MSTPSAPASMERRPAWLVGPAFDLLVVANLWWAPLVAAGVALDRGMGDIEFWQIYFLTTPHRWLTLGLVAADPDRRGGRSRRFVTIAVGFAALLAGIWWFAGSLLCLMMVDYVWNSWHFGAQHAGILRIYGRKLPGGWTSFERHGVRAFVIYTILRLAGWSTGWTEGSGLAESALLFADAACLALPVTLIIAAGRDVLREGQLAVGKATYATSLGALYGGLLLAVRLDASAWVLGLTVASAAFHAVEYLAIVTHYARRRRTVGSDGLFRRMAQQWGRILLVFLLAWGVLATQVDRLWVEGWLALNLWAAFLHYSYDGMIWKLRRPATAEALNSGEPGAGANA